MFGPGWAQTTEEQKTTIDWKEIQVVYDLNEVADMTQGSRILKTVKTSQNFSKSKRINDCLKELKKEAALKGYKVIYVDEEATKYKRFDKRGIKVTLVGVGYKS